jgi:hypothetical protein
MKISRIYVCPVCDRPVELMKAVAHILRDHPTSGVAHAIRAAVDQGWVESSSR